MQVVIRGELNEWDSLVAEVNQMALNQRYDGKFGY